MAQRVYRTTTKTNSPQLLSINHSDDPRLQSVARFENMAA